MKQSLNQTIKPKTLTLSMIMKYTIKTYFSILLVSFFGSVSSAISKPIAPEPNNKKPFSTIAQTINQTTIYPITDKNGKVGFINRFGKVVITPQFSSAFAVLLDTGFSTTYPDLGLIPVRVKDKWGYINNEGKVVISPQFEMVYPFTEGLAAVKIGNKWGYINRVGGIVIAPKFDSAEFFSSGLAGVALAEKSAGEYKIGFINKIGDFIIKPELYRGNDAISLSNYFFTDGLRPIKVNDKWGYLNTKGELVIKPQFAGAGLFSEGLTRVVIIENGLKKEKIINKSGQVVFTPNSKKIIGGFSEGLLSFQPKGKNRYGFVNKKGEVVIRPEFTYAAKFSEGLACVQIYDEKERGYFEGYINKTGKFVIKPRFGGTSSSDCNFHGFRSGLAYVDTSEYYGYINKEGSLVWKTLK
jgi:WG containing repeat